MSWKEAAPSSVSLYGEPMAQVVRFLPLRMRGRDPEMPATVAKFLTALLLLFSLAFVPIIGFAGCSPENNSRSARTSSGAAKRLQNKTPEFMDGDIIAHTSRSNQSMHILTGTNSKYTHMGFIVYRNNEPFVLEAVQPVKYTPLDEWIKRGKAGNYTLARLDERYRDKLPAVLEEAEKFLGKQYDSLFEPSDSRIYCSELVQKAMERGAGIEVGKWERFGDVLGDKRNDPSLAAVIKERWGKSPDDMKVITPKSIMDSELLEKVYSNY